MPAANVRRKRREPQIRFNHLLSLKTSPPSSNSVSEDGFRFDVHSIRGKWTIKRTLQDFEALEEALSGSFRPVPRAVGTDAARQELSKWISSLFWLMKGRNVKSGRDAGSKNQINQYRQEQNVEAVLQFLLKRKEAPTTNKNVGVGQAPKDARAAAPPGVAIDPGRSPALDPTPTAKRYVRRSSLKLYDMKKAKAAPPPPPPPPTLSIRAPAAAAPATLSDLASTPLSAEFEGVGVDPGPRRAEGTSEAREETREQPPRSPSPSLMPPDDTADEAEGFPPSLLTPHSSPLQSDPEAAGGRGPPAPGLHEEMELVEAHEEEEEDSARLAPGQGAGASAAIQSFESVIASIVPQIVAEQVGKIKQNEKKNIEELKQKHFKLIEEYRAYQATAEARHGDAVAQTAREREGLEAQVQALGEAAARTRDELTARSAEKTTVEGLRREHSALADEYRAYQATAEAKHGDAVARAADERRGLEEQIQGLRAELAAVTLERDEVRQAAEEAGQTARRHPGAWGGGPLGDSADQSKDYLLSQLKRMSVYKLRQLLDNFKIPHRDCIEKAELLFRAQQAVRANMAQASRQTKEGSFSAGGPAADGLHGGMAGASEKGKAPPASATDSPLETERGAPGPSSSGGTPSFHRADGSEKRTSPMDPAIRMKIEKRKGEEEHERERRASERVLKMKLAEMERQRSEHDVKRFQDSADLQVRKWAQGKSFIRLLTTIHTILPSRAPKLKLTLRSTASDIKLAYKKALRAVHPDKMAGAPAPDRLKAEYIFNALRDGYTKDCAVAKEAARAQHGRSAGVGGSQSAGVPRTFRRFPSRTGIHSNRFQF